MEIGLLITLIIIFFIVVIAPLGIILRIYLFDHKQKEHSVLRNYPVLGKARYVLEKAGPELRQYLYNNDKEGKPFNRQQFDFVNIAGKYNSRMLGYGSQRDFDMDGLYIVNTMYPKQREEMCIDQDPKIKTFLYKIDNEKLFARKEHREEAQIQPFYLTDENAVVIGKETARQPFAVKGLIGQSAMSYGSLGGRAISALSQGLGMAGGTWMNTGEGSVSSYHLKGNVDIIMQISPGLFGVRTEDGEFSLEAFKKKSEIEQIKAFELKLAQGAKTRGGHVDGKKVTEEIADIRNVEPWKAINSPNRFHEFSDTNGMLDFIEKLRHIGGKPVGVKVVIGNEKEAEQFVKDMAEKKVYPDFITIDGGEGGTGASYYELAASVGLPAFAALPLVNDLLEAYGVRDKVHIIASGKLLTPDKVAMALALGADLVNIARGFMMTVGCIMSQVCHTNNCPVGVATTDPELQRALVVEEKKYRTCNYLVALREGLFNMAAVAGIDSPTKFTKEHIVYKEKMRKIENPNQIT